MTRAKTAMIPLDYYMAADGLRIRNDTRWIGLILHDDGSVAWLEPIVWGPARERGRVRGGKVTTAAELREALFWQREIEKREIEKDIRQSAPHPDTAEAGISVLATVFDAARTIALPILEGGEKVWFCEAHKAMSASGFPAERQICPVYVVLEGAAKSECRMVERILIPLPQMVAGEYL